MDIQKKLGITLKQHRTSIGISQENFALSIGMDRTYYASVEAGKRNISLLNLQKIANGFSISLSDLFFLVENTSDEALKNGVKQND